VATAVERRPAEGAYRPTALILGADGMVALI
jgi:hypothetical protein